MRIDFKQFRVKRTYHNNIFVTRKGKAGTIHITPFHHQIAKITGHWTLNEILQAYIETFKFSPPKTILDYLRDKL